MVLRKAGLFPNISVHRRNVRPDLLRPWWEDPGLSKTAIVIRVETINDYYPYRNPLKAECYSEPWTSFRLLPWDRKDKKDRTGLVFSVILDTLIISQAPLLSQDVIYYALTLSFTKFPHKTKVHRNLTSPAHNYGLLRLDYDEIFKVSLLIRQNLLESAKRLWLTLHIEHRYHLIHQRAIRISKQNTKVQTAKTDCAIAWSKVCLRNLTPRKYYLKTGTEKVF